MAIFSVVIPAYNEESGIGKIIERALEALASIPAEVEGIEGTELVVVNDGSRDKTAAAVGRFPGARLISHPKNRGYGAALKTGFEAARGEFVGFLDADGTYPPEHFRELLRAAAGGADLVIGTRMAGGPSGMPLTRKVGNLAFATLLSWIVNRRVSDTASGMRVFRKAVLDRMAPLPDGLDLTPAMSTIALHEGLKVVEVPIPYEERVGRSKLSVVKDGIRFLRTIVGLAETYNALKFFGTAGLLLLVLALALGVGPAVHYLDKQTVPNEELHRLLTILVLAVLGMDAIVFGIAANHTSAVARRRPPAPGRLAFLVNPRLLARLGPLGILLILAAAALNAKGVYNLVFTGRVILHWSYVYTGAFLVLIGAHLVMISRLVRVFDFFASLSSAPEKGTGAVFSHGSEKIDGGPVPLAPPGAEPPRSE